MSSFVEEVLDVAKGVLDVAEGVVAEGVVDVAEGVVDVAEGVVAVAERVVAGSAVVVAESAIALGKVSIDAFNELKEFHEIGKEEKKAYKEALNEYHDISLKNEEKYKEYVIKLKKTISPTVFSLMDNWLNKINDSDKLIELIKLQTYIQNIENIFRMDSFDLTLEDKFYALRDSLEKKITRNNFDFSKDLEDFDNLLSIIKQEVASKKYEDVCKKIDVIIFDVKNIINDPLIIIFHNELLELLKHNQDNTKEIMDFDKELVIRKQNINDLVKECSYISHPCKSLVDFNIILNKVKEQLSDDNISSKEKIMLCDMHYKWLCDDYIKIKLDYKSFESNKKRFDILKNYYCKCLNVLNRPMENLEFNFENPQESINILQDKINFINKETENESKVILTLKSIDSVMKRNGFRKINSKTIKTKKGITHKEIYHLENGNVVSFFVTHDSYKFSVNGVKIDGTSKDVYSINQSQVHMCKIKKEIEKMLISYGIETTTKELIKPELRFATEIELEDVSYDQIEYLKTQKRKNVSTRRQSMHKVN